MGRPDVARLVEQCRRDLDLIEARYGDARRQARLEDDAPGLGAQVFDREGSGGGGPADPTGREGSRGVRLRAVELERLLLSSSGELHRLAGMIAGLLPVARTGDGRVGCGNVFGCPEGKRAVRQGRCMACAMFLADHGRERTVEDRAEQLIRERRGWADRKQAQRARAADCHPL